MSKIIQGYQSRKHPLYATWAGMKDRCYNKKSKFYKNYGGRGIKVSKRWKNSFETFVLDIGEKPTNKHSLDRIENDKGYTKSNCRWASRSEQNNNKRTYKTSKTGYSGIRLTESGMYQTRTKGSSRITLGCFKTIEEALIAQKNNLKQENPRSNNTTGVKGVTKQGKKFLVRKVIDGKRVYLGNTDTLKEAIALYENGVKQKRRTL